MDFKEWLEYWRDVIYLRIDLAEGAWTSARKGMVPVERMENLLGVIGQVIDNARTCRSGEPYGVLVEDSAAWQALLNGFNYESELIKENSA